MIEIVCGAREERERARAKKEKVYNWHSNLHCRAPLIFSLSYERARDSWRSSVAAQRLNLTGGWSSECTALSPLTSDFW